MATHQPSVLLTARSTNLAYANDTQHMFLLPSGVANDPARPYGFFQPTDREYKALRDGSHDTGVHLAQQVSS